MQKLSNTEAESKKSVTFIKKRELVNFQYNRLNGFWPRFVLKQDSEWILSWFWYCNILWKTACNLQIHIYRSNRPEVFLGKGVLKICRKFTGEHPCWSAISIKLQSSFIKITLWHGYSPVNLLYIFGTPFPKNTYGWLLL